MKVYEFVSDFVWQNRTLNKPSDKASTEDVSISFTVSYPAFVKAESVGRGKGNVEMDRCDIFVTSRAHSVPIMCVTRFILARLARTPLVLLPSPAPFS